MATLIQFEVIFYDHDNIGGYWNVAVGTLKQKKKLELTRRYNEQNYVCVCECKY